MTFYVHNQNRLENLKDLLQELKTIDNETFYHHVNEDKNDCH